MEQLPPPSSGVRKCEGDQPLDDQELLDRCEAGDEEAWRTLVARYERLVYAIPHRYGLGEDAAKDVFQEIEPAPSSPRTR